MNAMSILPIIENKIIEIRGVPTILDSDVAALYEVETRELAQAVKNNPDKFPIGYILELSKQEKSEVIKNFDNPKIKFSPALPKAFTEQGSYMLATILKSPKATQTTLAIIETFIKMRRLGRSVRELSSVTSDAEKKQLMQKTGEMITDIFADDLETLESESTIEINFALLKVKHTLKRGRKKKS
jgi:hypothetical protein